MDDFDNASVRICDPFTLAMAATYEDIKGTPSLVFPSNPQLLKVDHG